MVLTQYEIVDEPLSRQGLITINESRLPWILNADARLDKQFSVNLGTEESAKALNFNVFLRAENLFNRRNVVSVYSVSGNPDSDGYIITDNINTSSSNGLDQLAQIESNSRNVDSFLATYNWRVAQPGNFTRPRRLYVGLVFDF